MNFKSNFHLRKYLAKEILGKDIGRKPPGKARRTNAERSESYKSWIRTLPCAACGIEGQSEAAHTGNDGGMSMKASDLSCIPLCPECHTQRPDSYHRHPDGKAGFEKQHRIDCAAEVERLNGEYFGQRKLA